MPQRILYDLDGNLEALQALLAREPGTIVCAGDVLGVGSEVRVSDLL